MKKELQELFDLCLMKGLTADELTPYFTTIEHNLKGRRYGLVWEESLENIADQIKVKFPVIEEFTDLRLGGLGTTNCLIEGDNYESLTLLKNIDVKIPIIYIDPPYNTGNGFTYNDKIVEKDDSYKHSKWLSFMNKRLRLARDLLTDDGIIYVSIDDNEQANLKLLCDQIFGEKNFISVMSWIKNKNGRQLDKFISNTKEYVLMYGKDSSKTIINQVLDSEYAMGNYKYKDDISPYKRGDFLSNNNSKFNIITRSNLCYSIYYNPESGEAFTKDEKEYKDGIPTIPLTNAYESDGFVKILPPFRADKGNQYGCWRWGETKFKNEYKQELIFEVNTKKEWKVYSKNRIGEDMLRYIKAKDVMVFSGVTGGLDLENILGGKFFSHPKPKNLIKHLIALHPNKNALVLDFFAGSGTTGHAVMELNDEDGGNRQFILCTNNELDTADEKSYLLSKGKIVGLTSQEITKSYKAYKETEDYKVEKELESYQSLGICRKVTYPRLFNLMNGYKTLKGEDIDGYGGNLHYFKVSNIDREVDETDLSNRLVKHMIPFIEIHHNLWNLSEVGEDTYSLTDDCKWVGLYTNQNYITNDLYTNIPSGKKSTLYMAEGLINHFNILDYPYVDIREIPKQFYKEG